MACRRIFVGLGLLVMASAIAWAAQPLASIRSSESFQVQGDAVPVAGLRAWPLVEGDEIVTYGAPAIVMFPDGSRVVLSPKSRAKVESKDSEVIFRLLAGALEFRLALAGKVRIYNREALQTGTAGTFSASATPVAGPSPSAGRVKTQALPPLSRWR
ncbi:MAG: hypothetical protein ABSD27_03940 [Bryobacteraceae bacterium]|jgi:hypothetical protein